jgi:hypothetical protein
MVTMEESVGSLTDPVPAGDFGLCDALCRCPDCRHLSLRKLCDHDQRNCAPARQTFRSISSFIDDNLYNCGNERETAIVLAHSLRATLQGGRNIEATNPPTYVDYLAEAALRISFFTFFVSTFGTAFTVLLGWRSDREFKLKIVQLEAQVAELKRQSLKDKAGPSQPSS